METRQQIDDYIQGFRANPNEQTYRTVYNWYVVNNNAEEQEYMTCVYLFLRGANIKHRYDAIDYDTQMDYIREISKLTSEGTAFQNQTRKAYLEFGTKTY